MHRASSRPPRPGLVGRSADLAALDDELARCARGEFGCVVLVGEPGVGKSRLAAEFSAAAPGVTTLSARAFHLGATTAFGVWAEALDRELRRRPPESVRAVCAGLADDLSGLLRGVAAAVGTSEAGRTAAADPPRSRLLDALAGLLRALASERPVIVVIDFIGERTVESHLARAYARLGVRPKVELARRASELGLTIRTEVRTATADAPPPRA